MALLALNCIIVSSQYIGVHNNCLRHPPIIVLTMTRIDIFHVLSGIMGKQTDNVCFQIPARLM